MSKFLCRLGIHTGHAQGGTLMFTCSRCKRSLWQPARHVDRLRAIEREADARIARGDLDAGDWAQGEVRRVFKGEPRA